tara:strand:- start:92 stop:238 length:147 start_codon:yes stop_codon:yes gene_type:complete
MFIVIYMTATHSLSLGWKAIFYNGKRQPATAAASLVRPENRPYQYIIL